VLPLPPGRKSPPPSGFTGASAQIPTTEQIQAWCRERPDGNIALALVEFDEWDFALLGVDIDNYAKGDRPAGARWKYSERSRAARASGSRRRLPWHTATTAAPYGVYQVPKGLLWRSKLGAGVELIHKGHRYIAAGINPETGKHKRWRDADRHLLREPPRPQHCTELPDQLVLNPMRDANGAEVRGLATPEAGRAHLIAGIETKRGQPVDIDH
jgi:hypothetical protein